MRAERSVFQIAHDDFRPAERNDRTVRKRELRFDPVGAHTRLWIDADNGVGLDLVAIGRVRAGPTNIVFAGHTDPDERRTHIVRRLLRRLTPSIPDVARNAGPAIEQGAKAGEARI